MAKKVLIFTEKPTTQQYNYVHKEPETAICGVNNSKVHITTPMAAL